MARTDKSKDRVEEIREIVLFWLDHFPHTTKQLVYQVNRESNVKITVEDLMYHLNNNFIHVDDNYSSKNPWEIYSVKIGRERLWFKYVGREDENLPGKPLEYCSCSYIQKKHKKIDHFILKILGE